MTLSLKYRPNSFNEVVGQDSVIMVLKQQILNDAIKNCYIFSGSSGCGKTTMARIFAKELNGVDNSAVEIDAASNNGVDNARNIISTASEHSLSSKYKIIIMDEAHMLTVQAWNALLKTIEEPPRYTVFIFCTTNPDKIPDTIKNRCQRFNFTKISSTLIRNRLEFICRQEGYSNFETVCDYISKNCNNQMRDAIVILEQVADCSKDLSLEYVYNLLGEVRVESMVDLTNGMIDGNLKLVLEILDKIKLSGISQNDFVSKYFSFILDVNKYIEFRTMNNLSISESYETLIEGMINFENPERIYGYFLNSVLELRSLENISYNDITAYFIKMTRLI